MKQEPNTKQVSGWIMLNAVSYPLVFFCNGKPDKPGGFLVRNMIYIHGGFDAIVNVICHIIVDSQMICHADRQTSVRLKILKGKNECKKNIFLHQLTPNIQRRN